MQEEFEKLGSVEEMFEFLSTDNTVNPTNILADDLKILNVQMVLRIFPHYMTLSEDERKTFREVALAFNDEDTSTIVKQSALATACELLFPEETEDDEDHDDDDPVEMTKKDKPYPIPCEECEGKPSYKVEFRSKDRAEEHYLCDKCEKVARENLEEI